MDRLMIQLSRKRGEIHLALEIPTEMPEILAENLLKIPVKGLKKISDSWGISRKGLTKSADLSKNIANYFENTGPKNTESKNTDPYTLDQFYTNPDIAKACYDTLNNQIDIDTYDIILEPSAGKGAFYDLIEPLKRKGIDLDPKHPEVTKMDYFDYVPQKNKRYLVVGNPPFGIQSAIAIKFMNKSCEFADCVAFIIPRTFKRVSIQNRLSMGFKLMYCKDLPLKPCCFTPRMGAKCCFQIWVRITEGEPCRTRSVLAKTHSDFTFLRLGKPDDTKQPTPPVGADFAMRAYGSNCGVLQIDNLETLRPKSWHWIKSNIDVELLKKKFNSLDYSISKDTVRQDSIGQQELIRLYESSTFKHV